MKVLLITPNFFDYPQLICDELRRMGHDVDWFDDRPSTNPFIKAIIRINKDTINSVIRQYFNRVMQSIGGKKYDKVLLVSGQSLSFTEDMIIKLRKSQPQAEFVLYQWDSVANFPYIDTVEKHFDRCYSFDRDDVASHARWKFMPLFYSRKYEEIGRKRPAHYKYDVLFVGTAHPKKYRFVSEMSKKLNPVFPKQFIYFFFPSRLVYVYRKLRNPEFKHAKYSEFHFTSIKGAELDRLFAESKCILDSPQDGQLGLTMRVLETLGAKRKIITTNKDVVNYDFYDERNVYVYDGVFDFDSPFFKEDFADIDEAIYRKYSLNSWLTELLGE